MKIIEGNPERERLRQARAGIADWRRWGPYLSDRQWGTVREDYSAEQPARESFRFDQARLRAYRWSEDGIFGISDDRQYLCFGFTFWNGADPFLKERYFGLTVDRDFLKRIFKKLTLNFTWWVNRKDAQGNNVFQGGFWASTTSARSIAGRYRPVIDSTIRRNELDGDVLRLRSLQSSSASATVPALCCA